jgi:hypothetical protein
MGEIFDGAFSAIRHNPKVMLGFVALVILAATVVGVLLGQLIVPAFGRLFGSLVIGGDFDATDMGTLGSPGVWAQLTSISLGAGLTFLVASPILNGILTVSVSRSTLGDRATATEVWHRVRPRLGRLIGWSFLYLLGIILVIAIPTAAMVGLLILIGDNASGAIALVIVTYIVLVIALTLWITVRTLMVPPALALETGRLWATVARGWKLTRGVFWRTLGIYLLASIIISVAASVMGTPVSLVMSFGMASQSGLVIAVVSVLTSVVTMMVQTIFLGGVVSLLYIDTRMRREGLEVAMAAAAAEVHRSL